MVEDAHYFCYIECVVFSLVTVGAVAFLWSIYKQILPVGTFTELPPGTSVKYSNKPSFK